MFHKKLLQPNPDLPQDKFYVTVRTFHDTILDKGFAIEQASLFLAKLVRANPLAHSRPGSHKAERRRHAWRLPAERVRLRALRRPRPDAARLRCWQRVAQVRSLALPFSLNF
jgi:hypothetical protein